MCGIAGIVGNTTNALVKVKAMQEAMKYRGPDDQGIFESPNMVFGHNRLSIIDTSTNAHQPMTSACGNYTIVFNGELYNYKQLQELLPAQIKLRSQSDTEILLELWALQQEKCLTQLRGMFAFAIWKHDEQKLFLVRDHMGIKPLYYSIVNDTMVFASELKGMLASTIVEKKMDEEAIETYLQLGYIIQPKTIWENVFMLPSATCLVYHKNKTHQFQYWNLEDKSPIETSSEEEAISQTRILLDDAISEELISDRPLGVFLSGGLDSTVLVAALKQMGIQKVNTFSVGFENDERDESDDAMATAAFYKTTHTQLTIASQEIGSHIDDFIKDLDQPSIDGLNTWLVSKATTKHVTVALSGLGGDEVFSGYGIDRKIIYRNQFSYLFRLLKLLKPFFRLFPKAINNRLKSYANWSTIENQYALWGALLNSNETAQLLNKQKATPVRLALLGSSPLQRLMSLHLKYFMQSRLLRDSDVVSMAHSLEVRFPLIDYRIVQFSWHLPDRWKLKKIRQTAKLNHYESESGYAVSGIKHLMFQAFKKDLPPHFDKRPKRGFRLPIDTWMETILAKTIEEQLTNDKTYLNCSLLKQYWENWQQGKTSWSVIWALFVFEKWVQQQSE